MVYLMYLHIVTIQLLINQEPLHDIVSYLSMCCISQEHSSMASPPPLKL